MRYAFLILGKYDSKRDRAQIHEGAAQIVGVSSVAEAEEIARALCASGVGCIELCGAFGPDGARRIIAATGGDTPVGYVTHLPEQDELYESVFS